MLSFIRVTVVVVIVSVHSNETLTRTRDEGASIRSGCGQACRTFSKLVIDGAQPIVGGAIPGLVVLGL